MYLVFDIGGTNMRVGVSSDGKAISQTKIVPTPKDFKVGIQSLKQVSDELTKGEKIIEVAAGGVAVVFDPEKKIAVKSAHLHDWVNKPLKKELEKIFGVPVLLDNDTALEGLAEAVFGAGKEKDIVVFVTIGTGIGGVKVIKGKLDTNLLGFEPGHQIIVPDGNLCECGGKGHLEAYVAGLYLERTHQKKAAEITNPEIWEEVARYLAIGLHNTTVLWSPEIIILGGSVAQSIPLDKVREFLTALLTIFPKPPEITSSSLGKEAGLYGALEYLKQQKI